MAVLYLGLGSNLGNRNDILEKALDEIENSVGHIVARSDFYETKPWGFQTDQCFLNACIGVETSFSPLACLDKTQEIERKLGRKKKTQNGQYSDRPIDIDLLLYDRLVVDSERLTIPHPLLHLRAFVLKGLAEIAGTYEHPVMKKTIQELWDEIPQSSL